MEDHLHTLIFNTLNHTSIDKWQLPDEWDLERKRSFLLDINEILEENDMYEECITVKKLIDGLGKEKT